MRLTYLDILEQCFRDKFRGYNKDEVDTFLHLVADDFKEMAEEIKQLNKKLEQKDRIIKQLQEEGPTLAPEMIKEKAMRIINVAREHADQHRKKTEEELSTLKNDILKMKREKKNLIEAMKSTALEHLAQFKDKK
ncbi:MAG: DivIVA domain-containing protein [Nitrospinaceae bacterium]|nr:DivIVA domain-containing protein [Nitrospinaceae bacterium]|tara:strand:+ start:272 stop:676 length:405 start_codon:yes stop_codon:yes gene_type:complete